MVIMEINRWVDEEGASCVVIPIVFCVQVSTTAGSVWQQQRHRTLSLSLRITIEFLYSSHYGGSAS